MSGAWICPRCGPIPDDVGCGSHLAPAECVHRPDDDEPCAWCGVPPAEHDRLRACADLAYAVVDSGLDTGRVRQGPVHALARHVAAMLDAGWRPSDPTPDAAPDDDGGAR